MRKKVKYDGCVKLINSENDAHLHQQNINGVNTPIILYKMIYNTIYLKKKMMQKMHQNKQIK